MKRNISLMVVLVVALLPATLRADVIGSWAEVSGSSLDTWTLTVTPKAGETMIGFDIEVFDTSYGLGNDAPGWSNNTNAFSTAKTGDLNSYTHFLLRTSHNPGSVADLVTVACAVDGGSLGGGLSIAAGTSASYPTGWNAALNLLQVVVPHGLYGTAVDPTTKLPEGLSVTDSSWAGVPLYTAADTSLHPILFVTAPVPEPSTLALLASGLMGLLAYAWKKRK